MYLFITNNKKNFSGKSRNVSLHTLFYRSEIVIKWKLLPHFQKSLNSSSAHFLLIMMLYTFVTYNINTL